MGVFKAFATGFYRVNRSKRYIFAVYGINVLLALCFAMIIKGALEESFGQTMAGKNMVQSYDDFWYRSYAPEAKGLAQTFERDIVGIGAVIKGLDAFVQGNLLDVHPGITALGVLYVLLWTFLSAGFIALYVNDEASTPFVQFGAKYFLRFVIINLLAWSLYFLILAFPLSWLGDAVDALTRETIDERSHVAYTVGKYLIVWLLMWSVAMLADYSKIFTVLQDHRNALTAPVAAMKLVFRNFLKTYGLYFVLGFVWVALMLLYWLIAPGAGQSSWLTILIAFLIGQAYVLSRLYTRCLFYAGQSALGASLIGEDESED